MILWLTSTAQLLVCVLPLSVREYVKDEMKINITKTILLILTGEVKNWATPTAVYLYKSDNHQVTFHVVMVDITPEPFSTSSRVIVNCGNIVSWNKIRKKAILTSTEEVNQSDCICHMD